MEEIIAAVIGVSLGGILTFWTSRQLGRQSLREQRVFDIQSEYYSERMTERRILADVLVRRHRLNFADLYQEAQKVEGGVLTIDEYATISYVFHFWNRVGKLLDLKMVRPRDVERIMGREIQIWLGSGSNFETILIQGVSEEAFLTWFDGIRRAVPTKGVRTKA